MAYIEVSGKRYKVIETLPFHGAGKPAKVVEDKEHPQGERVAVKQGAIWAWWGVSDRLGEKL